MPRRNHHREVPMRRLKAGRRDKAARMAEHRRHYEATHRERFYESQIRAEEIRRFVPWGIA